MTTEDAATRPGTPTATEGWKRPGMDSLLEPPEEAQPASALIQTSAPPELERLHLSLATEIVIVCHSLPRKLV